MICYEQSVMISALSMQPRCLLLHFRLHVRVDGLHVVEVLQTLNHLVDGLALLGRHVLQVVGDTGELCTCHLETVLLQVLLDSTE